MAAFSRGLRSLIPASSSKCMCLRSLQFSTCFDLRSGHNRWSKIKHDKAGVDAKKNRQRSIFSQELATISKLYGGDPETNQRLATAIATAKKAGFPKASIEAAIARGQGRSTNGATLEPITLEAILPPSIALIIDIETDNRKRTLSDLRLIVKSRNGTVTPTNYLFTRRGKVLFEENDKGLGYNEILENAMEAGADDVESVEEGSLVVWTEPSETTAISKALAETWNLNVQSSELVWHPNKDTLVSLESAETAQALRELLDALRDNPNVRGVYTNVTQGTVDDEKWRVLQERISN